MIARKKQGARSSSAPSSNRLLQEKLKLEGTKRKKRRIKLKAKNNNESIIEKFSLQSCKSAKYAKTILTNAPKNPANATSANNNNASQPANSNT